MFSMLCWVGKWMRPKHRKEAINSGPIDCTAFVQYSRELLFGFSNKLPNNTKGHCNQFYDSDNFLRKLFSKLLSKLQHYLLRDLAFRLRVLKELTFSLI